MHELIDQGWTISAIARRLHLDRKTVRRFKNTDLDILIASARDRRPSLNDPFTAYLQAQFAAGCTSQCGSSVRSANAATAAAATPSATRRCFSDHVRSQMVRAARVVVPR